MILAACCISWIVKSSPPEIANKTPLAPEIDKSRRGELIAESAAFSARPSPAAIPTPIKALPASYITDLISAKSTLIIPGVVINSDIPSTACFKTSSHKANASLNPTSFSEIAISLSLGITKIASTSFSRSDKPRSANFIL